ncbi:hypothetical protein [Halomonas halocynthiae]|uniref:hypothetical protein n=1 Tax=Halomonas halocynthiae TaxID=176290 RepID=UPI00042751FA|nr:hypothetical protein [Halomonas halocynthiae]
MHSLLANTFGGLSVHYYFRQFLFGLGLSVCLYFLVTRASGEVVPLFAVLFFVINTLLYPYARFVYEQIVGYIMGDNVFFLPLIIMLPVKFFTILMCWSWAVFIAPFGLAYLYFYHR